LDKYIADFYCHELKLVVEIDGSIHQLEKVKERDKNREEAIRKFGLQILRFSNEDVLLNSFVIENEIRALIKK